MRKGFLSIWATSASAVLALTSAQSQSLAAPAKLSQSVQPLFKEGEVLVKLKRPKGISTYGAQAHQLLMSLGRLHPATVSPLTTDKSLYRVKVSDKVGMSELLREISANPGVEYAEPNFIYHTMDIASDPIKAVVPNDPSFNLNWGLLNTGQKDSKGQQGILGADIGATKAWTSGTGSKDILVAVIDTGIDYNHPDLKANIWTNAGEIEGNGKDDDGNGFVDDVHGYNFEGKNGNSFDDNRHGTHCAGTIGADGDNGIGTAGVNWHVSIMGVKFLSASGSGSLADAVDAINYATKMGVKIMSNSWGGGGFSQSMLDAIKAAKQKGVLFVAAAGNEGNNNDANASYPASYDLDNIISVAATDNRDAKSSWSNYGARKVHLAAPGVNIYSTVPVDKGAYETLSGTSMATPHVSGAAALLWSLNKTMTYADVKSRLLATVDPVRSLKRKTLSGGRLNVYNAVSNIVPDRHEPPADRWKGLSKTVESSHPYANNMQASFEISHPGAKYIRVHFSKVDTEAGYDFVVMKDSSGTAIDDFSGKADDYMTDYIEGDKLKIDFSTDSSVNGWGFAIDRYEFID